MESTSKKSTTVKECLTVLIIAVALALMPHLLMRIIYLIDSHDDQMVGADIGGGLLAIISPSPLAFIIGFLKPLSQRIWIIAGIIMFVLSKIIELAVTGLSLSDVLSMAVFDVVVLVIIVGCGVLGSKLRTQGSI